nr:Lrp/AsnC family transcriptional regulator [Arsenicicoccus piscis]
MRLVHLLQIAPRISYAAAADILEVAPSTVAARWEALRGSGTAWIAVHPSPDVYGLLVAFVEVATLNTDRDAVVDRLAARREVVSVEVLARHHQLMATVFARDLAQLRRLTLDDLSSWPDVVESRTALVAKGFVDASG